MLPDLATPKPRSDVNAVAHQVAVIFLDDIAKVDAYPEFDTAVFRRAGVPLHHAVLNFDSAVDGVDDAPKLNQHAITGALDYATVVNGDCRIDQVATEGAQTRQDTVLVRAGQSAVANHIGGRNGRQFTLRAF